MIKLKKSKDIPSPLKDPNSKKTMKKALIIHPFLFGLFPILFLYSHNIGEIPFTEILIPSTIILGFTAIAVTLLWLILKRDGKKPGIITTCFLILFFSYGHIYDFRGLTIERFVSNGNRYLKLILGTILKAITFVISKNLYLIIVFVVIFFFCTFFTIRTRKNLKFFSNILNSIAICLIIIPIINIGVYKIKSTNVSKDISEIQTIEIKASKNVSTYPDIYYIILDGYASSTTLKEIYNFDNSEFEDYLIDKGFYIASESASNYPISFSLNMEYINYLSDKSLKEIKDNDITNQMIYKNKVMIFLKSKGYKYINFSSGWGATDYNPYADINIKTGTWNEFHRLLIRTTMLRILEKILIADEMRDRILITFSRLEEVHEIEGNKFIFTHIVCPHPPYLFDSDGNPVKESNLNINEWGWEQGFEQQDKYLNQLIFINKKVEVLIDEILSKSETMPIIVIQADHGPGLTFFRSDSGGWENPTDEMLQERMRILNAYYFPSKGLDKLYNSITPVNTFRMVFNLYFDVNYDLLEDQCYYSTPEKSYDFINVTDKVKYK